MDIFHEVNKLEINESHLLDSSEKYILVNKESGYAYAISPDVAVIIRAFKSGESLEESLRNAASELKTTEKDVNSAIVNILYELNNNV